MHADSLGSYDRTLPHPLGHPHDSVGRQCRRSRTLGNIHRGTPSEAGYATSCLGKWHIGAEEGRWPTDHGFDEWYGPLRTYDECMWPEDPHYVPERDGYSYMHEGRKDEGVRPILSQQLTLEMKRTCDLEYQERGLEFMERSVSAGKPFFLYFNHSLMHFPMLPRNEFVGKSTNGEWGDCLLMLDHDFGVLLDKLDDLAVAMRRSLCSAATMEPRITWRAEARADFLTARISVRRRAGFARRS